MTGVRAPGRRGPTQAEIVRTARALQAVGIKVTSARLSADGSVLLIDDTHNPVATDAIDNLEAELAAWREGRA